MYCKNCGSEMNEDSIFCPNCGCTQNQENETNNNNADVADNSVLSHKSIEEIFVDPTENLIATFGNNYIQNFAIKADAKQFAYILTDKRLYYKGIGYLIRKKIAVRVREEAIVDLEDITCSKFQYRDEVNPFLLVLGILMSSVGIWCSSFSDELTLLFLGAGVLLILIAVILHQLSKGTYFHIEYPNGSINSNIVLFGIESSQDFNRQLRRAKDKRLGKI